MSSLLNSIQNRLQYLADSTSSILKLDVEIIDVNLKRVACTGFARSMVGNYLTPNGVLNQTFYMQKEKNTAIVQPGRDERCCNCPRYLKCPWMGAIYSAIRVEGEAVGIFGITATNPLQAEHLSKNSKELSQFADSYAELLGTYTQLHGSTSADKTDRCFAAPPAPSSDNDPMPHILSADPQFLLFKAKVGTLAAYSSTILLLGETGTGKELFARGIHAMSKKNKGPFIAVNCGAIPENLIESELFGYKKGAFTGALSNRQGKFSAADHGTLFLDEVENMPLYLQQKLLRVLENKEVEPLGASQPEALDLRIVAATNHPLSDLVKQGKFREDLYHRLNVITLTIPPLRERGNDILYLSERFINKYNFELGKHVTALSEDVKKLFFFYPWRGNIRELQNTLEYAVCMSSGSTITLREIPENIQHFTDSACDTYASPPRPLLLSGTEADTILKALNRHGWNEEGRLEAAAELGISRATLYRKIKKYHLKSEL